MASQPYYGDDEGAPQSTSRTRRRRTTMSESYHDDGDYEMSHHSHRAAGSGNPYYDHATPYSYHHHLPRQMHGPDLHRNSTTQARIHEEDDDVDPPEQTSTRKRSAVACQRCRKRKIKCTGKRSEDMPCGPCRAAGAEAGDCTFMRIAPNQKQEAVVHTLPGTHITPISGSDTAPSSATAYRENTIAPADYGTRAYPLQPRPSLPVLHTRTLFPTNYDSQYESSLSSPADGYAHAAPNMLRQSSHSNVYSVSNFRPADYGTLVSAAPYPMPMTTTYCEPQHPAYSFVPQQTPYMAQPSMQPLRPPVGYSDTFHMSNLNASLPTHTIYDRRLPIPPLPFQAVSSCPTPASHVRPLGSFPDPRMSFNPIQSRYSIPYSYDSSSSSSRNDSIASFGSTHGLPATSALTPTTMSGPVPGYQLNFNTRGPVTSSPDISPVPGPTAEGLSNTSGSSTALAPSSFRFGSTSSSNGYGLPAMVNDEHSEHIDRISTSRGPPPIASLLSYPTEPLEPQYPFDTRTSTGYDGSLRTTAGGFPPRYSAYDRTPADIGVPTAATGNCTYNDTSLQHPQPQHMSTTSDEQQRAAMANRMSLAHLNADY